MGTVAPALALGVLFAFAIVVATTPHVLLTVHSVIEDVVSLLS
jgi:hypothetical protein